MFGGTPASFGALPDKIGERLVSALAAIQYKKENCSVFRVGCQRDSKAYLKLKNKKKDFKSSVSCPQ
jgi:hypothetical protein